MKTERPDPENPPPPGEPRGTNTDNVWKMWREGGGGEQPYDKTHVPTTTLDFWFVCSPPVNTKQAHCRGLPLKQRSEVAGILGRLLFEFFLQGFEVWRIKEWGIMMTPCCTLVNFTNDSLDWLLELCLGSSYDKWVGVLFAGFKNEHNSQHQSESVSVHRGKSEFPWDIETKYYKASICIKVKQVVLSSFLHAFKQLNWYFVKN